jgi:molybdopterin molybdotransferase
MLVTTGGASVGEHDLVQAGLAREGFTLDFWKIAMRPGKPLIAGRLGITAVLGLPGNPVSAIVCGILFLLPALDRLQGLEGAAPASVPARLGADLAANDQRADHLRATIEGESGGMPIVLPYPRQDSSMLRVLTAAEVLILRAPHAPALVKDAIVSVIRLDSLGV